MNKICGFRLPCLRDEILAGDKQKEERPGNPPHQELARQHGFRPRSGQRPASHGPRSERIDGRKLAREALSAEALRRGWAKVWQNHGASGGDRISCAQFAQTAQQRLVDLRQDLAEGSYRPGPLRRVEIPKNSGGVRLLSIPCVRDRIVQTAVAEALTPHFDEEFEPASFAYRPGRSVQQAVRRIEFIRNEGFTHVVDADIEAFFDRIDHDRLMARFDQSVETGPVRDLIWTWLTHAAPQGRGIAQGSPLSPLLANLYLDRLDEAFWLKGLRFVRFADDFIVLAKSDGGADKAQELTEKLLAEEGLTLNRRKTRVVDFETGFRFLGHLFVRSLAMKVAPEGENPEAIDAFLAKLGREEEAQENKRLADERETALLEKGGYRHSSGIRVLYVLEKGRRLRADEDALVVEEAQLVPKGEAGADIAKWRRILALPHDMVDRVEIGPDCSLDRATIDYLIGNDIPAAFVDGHGETQGWLAPVIAPDAARHMAQAVLIHNEARRLELARKFVLGRLRSQRTALRRLLVSRDDTPERVSIALTGLNKTLPRGPGTNKEQIRFKGPLYGADTIEKLRGHEGAATKLFWPALDALAEENFFAFKTRRRPANGNPANICLNVLSSLLTRDVTVAVLRASLHPGFGVLHGSGDGRDGCVYDLMEEFRAPLCDSLFVYCVNRRIIRPEHFERFSPSNPRHNRLTGEGYRALLKAYESRLAQKIIYGPSGKRMRWRQLMLEQARRLASHFEGRGEYQPFDREEDRREAQKPAHHG